MSFIDKLKSKMKSSGPDELIASLTGIKKEAKDYIADMATLNKTAKDASLTAGTKENALVDGTFGNYADNRRDYELAIGQIDRILVDFGNFTGNYAGFILNMTDVKEALEKHGKKETGAKKKEIDAAVKDLQALITAANTNLGTSLVPALEKIVKGSKTAIAAAKKKFDKEKEHLEQLAEAVIEEAKGATKLHLEVKKLAESIEKFCAKYDLKSALAALKGAEERKVKHASVIKVRGMHQAKMIEIAKTGDWNNAHSDKGPVFPPRVKKDMDGAAVKTDLEAEAIVKLIDEAKKKIRDAKNTMGIA